MTSIIMTPEQTATYDGADDRKLHELRSDLMATARTLVRGPDEYVEIYTADGIVAYVYTDYTRTFPRH